jgi:hypothetical protein
MTTRRYFAQKKIIHECDKIEMLSPHITFPITSTNNESPMLLAFDEDGIARKRAASTLGGTIILDPVGSTPNVNAALVTGSHLELEPCDDDNPGVLIVGTQSLPNGTKTLDGDFKSLKRLRMDMTSDSATGVLEWDGAENKRMKIHGYSGNETESGNFFAGDNTGNFTNISTGCVGIGRNVLSNLTGSNNVVAIGPECLEALQGSGSYATAIGSGAARNCLNFDDSLVVGANAATAATAIHNSTVLGLDAALESTYISQSIIIGNEAAYQHTEINDCIILSTRGTGSGEAYNCIYIGHSTAGGDKENEIHIGGDQNNTKIAGIMNATVEVGTTEVGMVTVYDNKQLAPLALPGSSGYIQQGVNAFSFPDNSSLTLPFTVGGMLPNPYCHQDGNTIVLDQDGFVNITMKMHSIVEDVNYTLFLRVNAINFESHSSYVGKRVTGLELAPSFEFVLNGEEGMIIDFSIAGRTNTGITPVGCDLCAVRLNFTRLIGQPVI